MHDELVPSAHEQRGGFALCHLCERDITDTDQLHVDACGDTAHAECVEHTDATRETGGTFDAWADTLRV